MSEKASPCREASRGRKGRSARKPRGALPAGPYQREGRERGGGGPPPSSGRGGEIRGKRRHRQSAQPSRHSDPGARRGKQGFPQHPPPAAGNPPQRAHPETARRDHRLAAQQGGGFAQGRAYEVEASRPAFAQFGDEPLDASGQQETSCADGQQVIVGGHRRRGVGGHLRLPAARPRRMFPAARKRRAARRRTGRRPAGKPRPHTLAPGRTRRLVEPRGGGRGGRFRDAPAAGDSPLPAEDVVGTPACRAALRGPNAGTAARTGGGVACRGFRRRGRCWVVDLRRRARDPRAGMGRRGVRRAACGRNGLFGPGRPHGMETPFRTLLRH